MVRFNMKLLTLLVIWFGLARGQDQQPITLSLPHDPTPNIIDAISTNEPFYQFSFRPQTIPVSYPSPTVLPIKPPGVITEQPTSIKPQPTVTINNQKHSFVQKPTISPYHQVFSTNIPVQASFQVADNGLISAAAHAYPVQHSVEINHGDYVPYQSFFVQQHLEPISRDQNLPPLTRPIHPDFDRPLIPQKQLRPYQIRPGSNQGSAKPSQHLKFIPQNVNLNAIPTNVLKPQQPYNAYVPGNGNPPFQKQRPYIRQHILPKKNQNTNQVQYSPPQQFTQSTPPNLPQNFRTVPVLLKPYPTQVQNPTQVKLLPVSNSIPVLPKPLPSPFVKNLPVSPRPLPLPIAEKPIPITHVDNKPVKEQSSEEQEEKRPSKEEEKESEESEEDDEEEEDEEGEEEEEERDYQPRYSHNYHKNTEFDRRRYRPTFDAAKYIFNEDSEEDEGGESGEEEEESEENQPSSKEERNKQRENETHRRREKARRPEKGHRPHQKRVAKEESEESGEAAVQETRRRPHTRKYINRPANYRR